MRILLAAPHCYPAYGPKGSGFLPKAYPSGSAYHLHDLLAKGLAEEGHDVFYYLGRGQEAQLPPGVAPARGWADDVDIFHGPIGGRDFAESVLFAARQRGKSCLLTCHMKEAGRIPQPNWIYVSRALAKVYGGSRVVLNGIDPADFIYSETKSDYFLFIGSMHRAIDKGLEFALSLSRLKGFRLIVAGTGLDLETVQNVAQLCRAAGAEYLGDVRGIAKAELLASACAVLFPSRLPEGCPLVILEAMMSGTPVISSRCGGTAEIVTSETGILCDTESDWSGALDRIAQISSARCREIASQQYHYRRMTKDYLQEYKWESERSAE